MRLLAFFLLLTGISAPAALGAAPAPPRGRLTAVAVDQGPVIDGTLQDPLWQKCAPLALGKCTAQETWPLTTTARVLLDATNLYVAFECRDPDTDALQAAVTERDGNVWDDDCVEVFVTGDPRTGYYHLAVNPKGVLMDSRFGREGREDRSYDSGATVKASIQKGVGWTVTLSVPLKSLGAYLGSGQIWPLNLNRTRPARGGQAAIEWSWAVLGRNDYHQVLDYGRLEGVTIIRRAGGVTREAPPAPAPVLPETGTDQGGVTVYRHTPELVIRDPGQGLAPSLDLLIRGSAGLKVAFLARGAGGVDTAAFNLADRVSGDNTTAKAYRTVGATWRPVLYRVDRFRYNGGPAEGSVAGNALFTGLRFHGRPTGGQGVLELREFTIYRGDDATPPTAPTGLHAGADDQGISLTWAPAQDNVGVAFYVISRAGADGKFLKVGQSCLPEYRDRPPAAGAWRYRVLAGDFQDNLGAWSDPVEIPASRGWPAPAPTPLEQDRLGYAAKVRAIHAAGQGKVTRGRVLCFGDSLTAATVYPQAIEAALGRYAVEAIGRPGWKTGDCRPVLDADLTKLQPEFCLILLGTNNAKNAADLPQAMDDLLAMARTCAARGVVPVIGTIPPRGFSDPQSAPEARYNELLIKTCRENQIPVAYLFEAFAAAGDRRQLLARDGVHLIAGGWAVAGPSWAAAMDQAVFAMLDR